MSSISALNVCASTYRFSCIYVPIWWKHSRNVFTSVVIRMLNPVLCMSSEILSRSFVFDCCMGTVYYASISISFQLVSKFVHEEKLTPPFIGVNNFESVFFVPINLARHLFPLLWCVYTINPVCIFCLFRWNFNISLSITILPGVYISIYIKLQLNSIAIS